MKKIGIIGFGRFGELLARLNADIFDIRIIESDPHRSEAARAAGYAAMSLDAIGEVDYIFLAVPISQIEDVLVRLSPLVHERQVVIDLCSVKVYPAQLMQKHISHAQILATHPMFGPDSASKGLEGLQVAFCPIRVDDANVQVIKNLWERHGVVVVETTPEAHDKDSVYSQAFTYSIAKVILNMNLPDITFTTRSFNDITEVAALSAKDTKQLFHDMLFYNPYFSHMKAELESSFEKTRVILDEIEAEQHSAGVR